MSNEVDAIVLAGGRGSRLGGRDKARLAAGGRSFLDISVDAVGAASRVVVVGPRRSLAREVLWTQESPPGGGPVAALEAGLELVAGQLVAVVAVDLPFLESGHIETLRAAASDRDGAIFVDAGGRDQPLAGVYRGAVLRRALERLPSVVGASMTALIGSLDLARVLETHAIRDCDTPDDVVAMNVDSSRR